MLEDQFELLDDLRLEQLGRELKAVLGLPVNCPDELLMETVRELKASQDRRLELERLVDSAIEGYLLPADLKDSAMAAAQVMGKKWLVDWLRARPVCWEALL